MSMLRLWADFNEVYDDCRIWTSLRPSLRRDPSLASVLHLVDHGEPIELYDGEGMTCIGYVERREDPIVWLKLDLATLRAITVEASPVPEPVHRYWSEMTKKELAGK